MTLRQTKYEANFQALKLERNEASTAFRSWRKCQGCRDAKQMSYCDTHSKALHRYIDAQENLKAAFREHYFPIRYPRKVRSE